VGSSIQSEPTELKACGSRLFGLQTWVALPAAYEEIDPSFVHYEEADLPVFDAEGKRVRLVVGQAWGLRSPVKTFFDTIYPDTSLNPALHCHRIQPTRSAQSMWSRAWSISEVIVFRLASF
jgi:redox-sensitive bicupin YhaK (pirin superfamily)